MPRIFSALRRRVLLSILLFPAARVVAWAQALMPAGKTTADESQGQPPGKRRVAVTISKETTRITEPLRKDGYVDYVAALDQRFRSGVRPANNASVLFWQAMGPHEIDPKHRDEYFKRLGIPPLPEKGNYSVPLDRYAQRGMDAGKPADTASGVLLKWN